MMKRCLWLAAACLALLQPLHAQNALDETLRLNVQFTKVPFREALGMIFKGSGLQYSIDPNVPDLPITLRLTDVTIQQALRLAVRQAASSVPGLTSSKDGDVYVVKVAHSGLANNEQTFEKILIQFQRADQIHRRLENPSAPHLHPGEPGQGVSLMPEGISTIHSSITDNSLLVRGTLEGIQALKNLVRLLDIPERTLVLTVGVTGPGFGSRELRIQSSARALNGRNVTIDEEVPTGLRQSKVKVRLEPFVRGDGAIHVDSDWDVSVSVPGAKGEAIRLVKRFQSSTTLQPGTGVAISTVDLGSWGGSGQVRFWLRGRTISGQGRLLESAAGEKFRDYVGLLGQTPYVAVGVLAYFRNAELVRGARSYELVAREQGLAEGLIAKASRPKGPGNFSLYVNGRLISARLIFARRESVGGALEADPGGEPYVPLEDVAKALGGKLEFDPLTDTYRIVGRQSLASLLGEVVKH